MRCSEAYCEEIATHYVQTVAEGIPLIGKPFRVNMLKVLYCSGHAPNGAKVIDERTRCPICGHQFDPVEEINKCPNGHTGLGVEFAPEELIGEDDDYAYCL